MQNARHSSTPPPIYHCIYCSSSGPFTDEHVFCAGLGGDDPQFMLHNLVCKVCNTDLFSPMEAEFMRNSPEAFSRVFLQPRGRDRKKASKSPTFRPESVRIFLPNGAGAEAEIRAGGQVMILPQFLLDEHGLHGQASDASEVKQFVADLSTMLGMETLPIVTKSATQGRAQYCSVHYRWDGQKYTPAGRASAFEPPTPCIWRDTGADAVPKDTGARVFRRPGGQVMIRTQGKISDADFLTALRTHVAELIATAAGATSGSPVRNSPVGVRLRVNIGLRERVLAKIGVNMVAHAFGEEVVRQPCFDQIKTSVLTGEPAIFCREYRIDLMAPNEFLARIFAVVPPKHHLCILTTLHFPGGGMDLMFSVRLYGGVMTMIRLARDVQVPLPYTPVFLMVDYLHHRVTLVDVSDFTTKFLYPELAQVLSQTRRTGGNEDILLDLNPSVPMG